MDGDVQFPRWYTPEGYDKPDLMYLILDKRGKFVKKKINVQSFIAYFER